LPPTTRGILESSLYVNDVERSARFYENIFGFSVIADFGERGCAMNAGNQQVLLLFKKGGSRSLESPHDGDGDLHIAFPTAADELPNWESWLSENGIAIEEKRLGMVAEGVFTSAISTTTCLNSSRPVPGVSIERSAFPADFNISTDSLRSELEPQSKAENAFIGSCARYRHEISQIDNLPG
jgi:catechol 2,3-dioxygenase-like lactoylglutathione lyase family enzyme